MCPETNAPLSDKEREVLHLIALGYSNNDAAEMLGKSLSVLNKQLASARHKLGARTKEQAVVMALKQGLLNI